MTQSQVGEEIRDLGDLARRMVEAPNTVSWPVLRWATILGIHPGVLVDEAMAGRLIVRAPTAEPDFEQVYITLGEFMKWRDNPSTPPHLAARARQFTETLFQRIKN